MLKITANRRQAIDYRAEQLVQDLADEARRLQITSEQMLSNSQQLAEYLKTGLGNTKHAGYGRWVGDVTDTVARPIAREMGQLIEDARRLDTLEECHANLLQAEEELAEQQ